MLKDKEAPQLTLIKICLFYFILLPTGFLLWHDGESSELQEVNKRESFKQWNFPIQSVVNPGIPDMEFNFF